MNKSELIDAIASGANMSKADAARALNATTGATVSYTHLTLPTIYSV